MRESTVPRNSRELAVRNQFFTPRHIVEFLADNTLGRLWFEMRQGNTNLKDKCSYLSRHANEVFLHVGEKLPDVCNLDVELLAQAERLQRPLYISFRQKKDPREIRMLDPAGGSGHFCLYCFGLFQEIYIEAYDDADIWEPLRRDFPDRRLYIQAIPNLILANNIFIVDIDPRAVQIAGLALWLRAQRAYNELNLPREQRLAISKINVVLAEPMPGEATFLDEFLDSTMPLDAKGRLLGHLLRKIFSSMELAGVAGSLLKIEREIAGHVADAKKRWFAGAQSKQGLLFVEEFPSNSQQRLDYDLDHVTDETFWGGLEENIYAALRSYAERAEYSIAFQRRLFADDTARSFAFIDLCRQRYDVVLMNPPFGEPVDGTRGLIDKLYPEGRNDLYASMVLRGLEMSDAFVGAITSRTFIAGRDHRHFRSRLVNAGEPIGLEIFVDLGSGVLDRAVVETCAYVLGNRANDLITYVNLQDLKGNGDIGHHLRNRIKSEALLFSTNLIRGLPKKDFLFDLSPTLIQRLQDRVCLEPEVATVTFGLTTKLDIRFVRLEWEAPEAEIGKLWHRFAKGGEYSWFTSDTHLLVKRGRSGDELAAFAMNRDGNIASTRRSSKFYGRAAVTFSRRSTKGLSVRRLREGTCFSDKSAVIVPNPGQEDWLYILPLLFMSQTYTEMIYSQSPVGSFEIGPVKRLPLPSADVSSIIPVVKKIFALVDGVESYDETCRAFRSPPPDDFDPDSIAGEIHSAVQLALAEVGLSADLEALSLACESFMKRCEGLGGVARFVSYALGIMFGRWQEPSVTWQAHPSGLMPYEAFPVRAPARALDAMEYDGVSVFSDDRGSNHDLVLNITSVFNRIAQEFENCTKSVKEESLRDYLARCFFAEHIRTYSASHRKAPIYWQMAVPSAAYSVWLYYQRLTKDTFYQVLNDHLTPKIRYEERLLTSLIQGYGSAPSAEQRKEIANQNSFVQELRAFRDEVDRISPLWNPNLNDGVIINFAPLWRLVPQNRSWQRECKECWDSLVSGELDWAHLAMHLWPERVIPKCPKDRSIAIAHGLDEVFWEEGAKGKWTPKRVSDDVIARLIQERTSPSVKAALNDLLSAPVAASPTKKRAARTKRA